MRGYPVRGEGNSSLGRRIVAVLCGYDEEQYRAPITGISPVIERLLAAYGQREVCVLDPAVRVSCLNWRFGRTRGHPISNHRS